MNGKLLSIGGFVLGLGGGSMINYFFPKFLWLGWTLIGLGIVTIIVGLKWNWTTKQWYRARVIYTIILRVITGTKEANSYLVISDAQQKNPSRWLYPVIGHIDLNRQGSEHDYNDVYVRFAIDSSLLFPISEYHIFIKLCLKIKSIEEAESDWYEILPYEPLRKLQRNAVGNKYDRWKNEYKDVNWDKCVDRNIIHLGFTSQAKERNKQLLEWMEDFRKDNSNKVIALLKIGIKFKKDDSLQVLEGSHWIAPMNDYRGE